jgi:hypothetical protein
MRIKRKKPVTTAVKLNICDAELMQRLDTSQWIPFAVAAEHSSTV